MTLRLHILTHDTSIGLYATEEQLAERRIEIADEWFERELPNIKRPDDSFEMANMYWDRVEDHERFITDEMTVVVPPWTHEHAAAALAENWLLSTRNDGYYEIQRFDDRPKPHWSDFEALCHVRAKAAEGSPLHVIAILLHGTVAP